MSIFKKHRPVSARQCSIYQFILKLAQTKICYGGDFGSYYLQLMFFDINAASYRASFCGIT